jgi:hypothetical protein
VFRPDRPLKADVFGRIERGWWQDGPASAPLPAVRRDTRPAAWWARPFARWLLAREAAALVALERIPAAAGRVPRLLHRGRGALVRTWLDGRPLQEARPVGDVAYFRAARRLLLALHRAGVVHNDDAKEPNWLVAADGGPALVDFQLASRHRRRTRWFRLLAREDLRHLLKHKRSYCPAALTAAERALLARPSGPARLLRAGPKRAYNWFTRRVLGWRDDEGTGLA